MELEKKALRPIVCGICGKEFTPTTYNQRYCSSECSREKERRRKREANRAEYARRKAERERIKRELEQYGIIPQKEERRKRPLYESENMNAIAEIARYGVHYGQTVARMYMVEANVKRRK